MPAPAPAAPPPVSAASAGSPGPRRIDDGARALPLFDTEANRVAEVAAAAVLPAHTLMARAGLATARLARALAPHARRAWIAAGPGNNGGDGLVAARHLRAAGLDVLVTLAGDASRAPADAAWALAQARAAGVRIDTDWPAEDAAFDLALDALLGLGASRAPAGPLAEGVRRLNAGEAPVLAVDLPTGLDADTGAVLPARSTEPGAVAAAVQARWTLALLAAKPGLFTGEGPALCGDLWFDPIGVEADPSAASAILAGADALSRWLAPRGRGGHKGRFGDVHVVGGDAGMSGAALLCARAASVAGAGRVFVHAFDAALGAVDAGHPELMLRAPVPVPAAGDAATWAAGCGGGRAVAGWLHRALGLAARLVLDADALNAVAASAGLQRALRARGEAGLPTILTPHPLEAARLLGATTAQVQADRPGAARALAGRTGACILLKGAGTVVAAPDRMPVINPTGNARLSSAGTGDVLAGLLAGHWSAGLAGRVDGRDGMSLAVETAVLAAWRHGRAAQEAPGDPALPVTAGVLVERLR